MPRRALVLVIAAAVAVAAVTLGGTSAGATTKPSTELAVGKALYRQYCGKCHALTAALAAGFGSRTNPLGGPSFNNLSVPARYSIQAVTEPTGGHESLSRKMSSIQVSVVAKYIAQVTARHPIPALPTDG